MRMSIVVNIIFYTLVIFFIAFLVKLEVKDTFCSNGVVGGGVTGDGYGKNIYGGIPADNDTLNVSLEKIIFLSKSGQKTVKWRRSLIVSLLCSILIMFILNSRLADKRELLSITLIIFVMVYASYSFFQYHYDDFQARYIQENVQNIELLLNSRKST